LAQTSTGVVLRAQSTVGSPLPGMMLHPISQGTALVAGRTGRRPAWRRRRGDCSMVACQMLRDSSRHAAHRRTKSGRVNTTWLSS
jgi:hypothetical protein